MAAAANDAAECESLKALPCAAAAAAATAAAAAATPPPGDGIEYGEYLKAWM